MNKEDRNLLLRDLCCRLPYGVIIEHDGNLSKLDTVFMCDSISVSSTSIDNQTFYNLDLDEFKPYLFPMSSMTEEQKKEYLDLLYIGPSAGIDYLIANHFDFRGLIPKDLAIDCTNLNIY